MTKNAFAMETKSDHDQAAADYDEPRDHHKLKDKDRDSAAANTEGTPKKRRKVNHGAFPWLLSSSWLLFARGV